VEFIRIQDYNLAHLKDLSWGVNCRWLESKEDLFAKEVIMRVYFLLVAALALTQVSASEAGDDQQNAFDQLRGSWSVVKADSQFEGKRFVFDGDKLTVVFNEDEKKEGEIKIDSDAKPAEIDIRRGDQKWLGIYEVSGDTLRICFSEKGDKRPTKFQSGKDVILVTLKRDKK
jgi:uncharacterized protein (TIGR03067 family)